MNDTAYCGRFAPSPTGPLHFGSLLAALASYCDARRMHGKWLLRIEDVDGGREMPGAADIILRTLHCYGFRWDEEAPRQSTRTARYQEALDLLIARRLVYPCSCSRQRLQHSPLGASGEPVYPGYCRPDTNDGAPPAVDGTPLAWRLRAPDAHYSFIDRVQGRQTQHLATECGDFVLKRRDGFFAYHLAVILDDIDQGVTDIVRGADLLVLTPRHLWLYEVFGHLPPSYLHIPVAATSEWQKLSKQTCASALPLSSEASLSTLFLAWRFLAQPLPLQQMTTLGAFWDWAFASWNPAAIPACIQLPTSA